MKPMTHLLRCNSCFIILSVDNSLVSLGQLFHTSDNKRRSLDFELFITLNSESEKVINGAAFRPSGHKSSDFQLSSKSVSLGTFAPRATPRRLKISHSMVRSEPPSASILPFTPRALVRACSLFPKREKDKKIEKNIAPKKILSNFDTFVGKSPCLGWSRKGRDIEAGPEETMCEKIQKKNN